MRSPTIALIWEIWGRQRSTVAAILAFTLAGRFVDPSPLVAMLWMMSFLLLFGIFTYSFPRHVFTLPVSSLRLVAVPLLTGIASVELLNVMWLGRLLTGQTSPWFLAMLLGALTVFYQAVLWTLERTGPLRFVVAGAVAMVVFGIGLAPSFPPTPPPPWRSEGAMAALVAALTIAVFLLAWRHIARVRSGGGQTARRFEPLVALASARFVRTRKAFASPQTAHFWFEWRCSGLVLPILVGCVLLVVIAPQSWFARNDPAGTFRLLLGTLATPIVLAIPVGMAFARPAFWSEDLAVPAFVAVRPLTDEELVDAKIKVAAASVVLSWLFLFLFLVVWLSVWADLDGVSRFVMQVRASHAQSVAAVYGIGALVVIGGMFLTWRFLVSRLCSGLCGNRLLFNASVMSAVIAVIAWLMFDGPRLMDWLLDDPARMAGAVWILSIAGISKCWLALWSWRRASSRFVWQALFVWAAGTACFVGLVILLRRDVAIDLYSFQTVTILVALLAVPLGRVGLAPSYLARNRHR